MPLQEANYSNPVQDDITAGTGAGASAVKREGETPSVLPPKRVRRKAGAAVQPVPRSSKKPGELLTADEKKVCLIYLDSYLDSIIILFSCSISIVFCFLNQKHMMRSTMIRMTLLSFLHSFFFCNPWKSSLY